MENNKINQVSETVYIVTGAGGFIGNNIVRQLVSENKNVRCYVRDIEKVKSVLKDLPQDNITYVAGDVNDRDAFLSAFDQSGQEKIDFVVIHAAGYVSLKSSDSKKMEAINVDGTKNIANISVEKCVKKFVFISSVHALKEDKKGVIMLEKETFENFKGAYAKTKSKSTSYIYSLCQKNKLNAVILHPSGVIGPNDYGKGYLTKMIIDYNEGKLPAGVKGGYDFVDVRDVAKAAVTAADKQDTSPCYLVTGRFVTVKEILGLLYETLNKKKINLMMPLYMAYVALPFLTLYSKLIKSEPLYNSYSLYTLTSNGMYSNERAKNELNYTHRDISESIKDTVEFLKKEKRI